MRSGQFYAQPSEQVVGRSAGSERRREGRGRGERAKRKRTAGEMSGGGEDSREKERLRSEEEEKEGDEDKEEDEDNANEEDRVDAGRSLLQPRERCTHAIALAGVGWQVIVVVGMWIRVVDLNVLQKK